MIAKPAKLERQEAAYARRQAKARTKRTDQRAAQRDWSRMVSVIWRRDEGRCRSCGVAVRPYGSAAHPTLWGHVHHIVYRSAGGEDRPNNLALLCGQCHLDEHHHRITITGDGNGDLSVTWSEA